MSAKTINEPVEYLPQDEGRKPDDENNYQKPPVRRLRVYAFDPQASTDIETASINLAVIALPWEAPWEAKLSPGPVNEYLEVIDIDPVSGQFYEAIDLNHPYLLAQDGLAPTEGDPRFHQQMTFAVAMKTIKTFEHALGRKILWATERTKNKDGEDEFQPVTKLRIYPHGLREPNAYYSLEKKALLFGYFRASTSDAGGNIPGSWVFTALSHDIIVHETTHAILDGLHRRYAEPTSVDSLAFHEGFSDIVALLLHFTLPEAVANQIARMGGDLSDRTLLSDLALQFGKATGRRGALRSAIGITPLDPTALYRLKTPHERGAILVAAVFDAFVTIYERRTADLMRIASIDRTQVDQNRGQLHPDLVNRLTNEAVKSASHVLRICLRALDYLPTVDVRFGEFLRAMITADTDLFRDDSMHYRLAIIEAFRSRGIYPDNCLSLAPDSLLWERPDQRLKASDLLVLLDLESKFNRKDIFEQFKLNQAKIEKWFNISENPEMDKLWADALGISIVDEPANSCQKVEVHSVRTTRRTGPEGEDLRQLIIEITQRRPAFFNEEKLHEKRPDREDFFFRGGATIIVDLRDGSLVYVIRKKIMDEKRLNEQRQYLLERNWASLGFTYHEDSGKSNHFPHREPFAMTHRGI